MIETVEQLKKERPDLVESFENMSKEHLRTSSNIK